MTSFDQRKEEFKDRIKVDRNYCEYLFEYATIRLMAHKYAYYILNKSYIDDIAYDLEEESWRVMGQALGLLKEDEITPCVGFDPKHPCAKQGIELALRLVKK